MSKKAPKDKEELILEVHRVAEAERAWLGQHPEVLEPYRGQWVLVHNHRVVANSPDGLEVARLAPAADYPGAIFEYIPTLEELNTVFIL